MRLDRTLRGLQQTEEGLAKAVNTLSQAVDHSRQASKTLVSEIEEAAQELDRRYGKLKSQRQEIDDVLDAVDGQIGLQLRRCQEARQLTERALTPLVRKAEMDIQALTKGLELKAQMDNLTRAEEPRYGDRYAASGLSTESLEDILGLGRDTLHKPADRTVDPKRQAVDERSSNPFLRAVGE